MEHSIDAIILTAIIIGTAGFFAGRLWGRRSVECEIQWKASDELPFLVSEGKYPGQTSESYYLVKRISGDEAVEMKRKSSGL